MAATGEVATLSMQSIMHEHDGTAPPSARAKGRGTISNYPDALPLDMLQALGDALN